MKNNDKSVNILTLLCKTVLSSGTFVGPALNNVACITAGHLGIAKRIGVGTRLKERGVGEADKKISCSQSVTSVPQVSG